MKQFMASLSTILPMALTLGLAGLLPFRRRLGCLAAISGRLALRPASAGLRLCRFDRGLSRRCALGRSHAITQCRIFIALFIAGHPAKPAGAGNVVLPQRHALLLLLSMFIAQGVVDMLAVRRGHLVDWQCLRLILTSGVSLCLLSMLLHNFLRETVSGKRLPDGKAASRFSPIIQTIKGRSSKSGSKRCRAH